ncbi:NAD(P)-binding protein [Clavulina sp. PMI_390]|nr:NAD(P)-binding protein [Clavulina sp. PMI_390]
MSSSSPKKIIAVLTATGKQGGGVARTLVKDGTFAVRALTRNPDSAAAQALVELGIEVVKADAEDVDSLKAAFAGVYGVYANTEQTCLLAPVISIYREEGFDGKKTGARETQQGRNLVDAAKAMSVQHFIWSTLEHVPEILPHHYEINAYLASSGIPHWTLFYTSSYYSNMANTRMNLLVKGDDGKFSMNIPCPTDIAIPYFDGGECGLWVLPIFLRPDEFSGQRVDGMGEMLSQRDFATIITRVTGIPCGVKELTVDEFWSPAYKATLPEMLWQNFAPVVTGDFTRDVKKSMATAVSPPTTFEEFLRKDTALRKHLGLVE